MDNQNPYQSPEERGGSPACDWLDRAISQVIFGTFTGLLICVLVGAVLWIAWALAG